MFGKLYSPKHNEQPLERLKASDPSCLPPCKSVLFKKIERSNYVALIWQNASMANTVDFGPDQNGLRLNKNKDVLSIVWYDGERYPSSIVLDAENLSSEDEEEVDVVYSDSEGDD